MIISSVHFLYDGSLSSLLGCRGAVPPTISRAKHFICSVTDNPIPRPLRRSAPSSFPRRSEVTHAGDDLVNYSAKFLEDAGEGRMDGE